MHLSQLLGTLTLGLTLSLAPAIVRAEVESGKIAPNFTLPDSTGKTHSLSSFKGKFVVLEWTNHECPFVVKHYGSGNMQALQKEYTGKDVVWLSIVSSAPEKQGYVTKDTAGAVLKEQKAAPTALLLDPDGKVGNLYGAKTTPHIFIINPEGLLIYQGAIDDKKSTKAEDIAGAKNYVRATLDAALAGKPVEVAKTTPYGCSVKY